MEGAEKSHCKECGSRKAWTTRMIFAVNLLQMMNQTSTDPTLSELKNFVTSTHKICFKEQI